MKNSSIFPAATVLIVVFLLIPEDLCEKIIGGNKVTPHSRPYMVLLKAESICAGALIAKDWVLTAAHCDLNQKSQIILGAHSISKNEPEKQIRVFKKEFPYPWYDRNTHEGDLKLLKLNKTATLNKNVAILRLPEVGSDVKPGTACRVAGWGQFNNNSPKSDILREVNVTIIDRKICNDQSHYNHNPVIGRNMICAGSLRGGKDSCHGDSGSPLICEGIFRGITAFGIPKRCGDPRGPGVYILLSKKHLNWIVKTMKQAV